PKYDWVKAKEIGIVLEPHKPKPLGFAGKANTRVRLAITSDLPITLAVRSSIKAVGSDDTSSLVCLKRKVWKVDFTCSLPSDNSFLVMETDTINKPRDNKVDIVLYRWACIENCPVEEKKAAAN